ncbi:hypothetical protein I4F81_012204 [Pyropia yezoensis]|uniref:Uncharacterized protein n=1 Tax=Pyropia yezoensis TaxID=2788 RepID=A0ACC3CI09_PYRYE|nr:hypothetical protein I4F81_012204 [Neopyropia yezoensis]
MRCNADTVLVTPDVRLVPYRPEHVATYHGWMQDAELLRLTASERLDAAEEAANQASWAADASKGTFIILEGGRDGSYAAAAPPMVGDVNFYLLPAVLADNAPSLALFRRLGFGHERPVAAFGEVHLRLTVGVTEVGGTPPALPPTLSYPSGAGATRTGAHAVGGRAVWTVGEGS